ncbi:MAG: hypothetical protein FWF81_06795 [Defluviitaleaceae bacterium]|nr:hypothetical protein [Defluviitaleaceae bacterium]
MTGINTNATLYCALTPQELGIAKLHHQTQKVNSFFNKIMSSTCDEEIAQLQADYKEARAVRRELQQRYSADFAYHVHGLERLCCSEMVKLRARLRNNFGFINFNLPRQDFNFDEIANAIIMGIGSRIQMGHYQLHVLDYKVAAFTNDWRDPRDGSVQLGNTVSAYTQPLEWLLRASESGNASLAYEKEINTNALSLLKKMGVDTSRAFSINGTMFEIRNGVIQTKNFTPQQPRQLLDVDGLNRLVERAYAQGLLRTSAQ